MRWYASLRRSGEIAYVRRAGRHVGRSTLSAYGTGAAQPGTRVCITVAKTVGCSVLRNLVRRRIRGALDRFAPDPADRAGLRIVIVARPAAATEPYERLEADVRSILERLREGTERAGRSVAASRADGRKQAVPGA
jgi:ribonuclease P protein component